ncbi:molybdopterin converting factor subunit 1 [Parvibaculum sp.]|uniref:molybdopterin converting factor subunit 1 n=1 Tax=Parvibaculum sp. TaxID=2024848 RepID=UPI000C947BAC|nr:molybdopterin converting factor subunit 1 [Parvibaculum sp.]MAB13735.1 molybdopterin converting factor subunit 1 [Parvibaculum sp.]
MKLLYFAWVKQKTGTAEEDVTLPPEVTDVTGLIDWLRRRDEGYEAAFEDLKVIRCAVDQEHADLNASIAGAQEVAFFPPVTGG